MSSSRSTNKKGQPVRADSKATILGYGSLFDKKLDNVVALEKTIQDIAQQLKHHLVIYSELLKKIRTTHNALEAARRAHQEDEVLVFAAELKELGVRRSELDQEVKILRGTIVETEEKLRSMVPKKIPLPDDIAFDLKVKGGAEMEETEYAMGVVASFIAEDRRKLEKKADPKKVKPKKVVRDTYYDEDLPVDGVNPQVRAKSRHCSIL